MKHHLRSHQAKGDNLRIHLIGYNPISHYLAHQLVQHHAITLITSDTSIHEAISPDLDLNIFIGKISEAQIQKDSDLTNADLIIANEGSDELNFWTQQLVQHINKRAPCLIRVGNTLNQNDLLAIQQWMPCTTFDPKEWVAKQFKALLDYPGLIDYRSLPGCDWSVGISQVHPQSDWCEQSIATITKRYPQLHLLRINQAWAIHKDIHTTIIKPRDQLTFLFPHETGNAMIADLNNAPAQHKSIVIGGGGHVGFQLAKTLSPAFTVKVIENNRKRCQWLSSQSNQITIMHQEMIDFIDGLTEEEIENICWCSASNDDEANILAALQAKTIGIPHAMCLIHRPEYQMLAESSPIDALILPKTTVLDHIQPYTHTLPVKAIRSLPNSEAKLVLTEPNQIPEASLPRHCHQLPVDLGTSTLYFCENEISYNALMKLDT
jgi:trk system potassium uptake protein TrkA